MKLFEITNQLEQLAPLKIAEDFDNVGLLVGNRNDEIKKVLVTLDATEDVVDEAIEKGANLIISFHPIVFKGLKSITGKNYVERAVLKAIKNEINIYAIHTALDNVEFGLNYEICNRLGLKKTKALIPKNNQIQKLTTYVPTKNAEELRNKLFESGAGNIGNYSFCSFNLVGKGSFKAEENANPTIGEIGQLHYEEEEMINVVFHTHLKHKIVDSLLENHPYETVAYEIYDLQNSNNQIGMGRIGELEVPLSSKNFLKFVKDKMQTNTIRHSKLLNQNIKKVAVLGGSGAFAIEAAKAQGADAFISADLKYHDFFQAENQIILMDIGHYESEQFTKDLIVRYLSEKFRNFAILKSDINTNPVNYF